MQEKNFYNCLILLYLLIMRCFYSMCCFYGIMCFRRSEQGGGDGRKIKTMQCNRGKNQDNLPAMPKKTIRLRPLRRQEKIHPLHLRPVNDLCP